MSGLWGMEHYSGVMVGGPKDGARVECSGKPKRILSPCGDLIAIYEPTDTPAIGDLWERGTILFMGTREPETDQERDMLAKSVSDLFHSQSLQPGDTE